MITKIQEKIIQDSETYSDLLEGLLLNKKNPFYATSSECEIGLEILKKFEIEIPKNFEKKLKKSKISLKEFLNKISIISYILALTWKGETPGAQISRNFINALSEPIMTSSFSKMLQFFRKMNKFKFDQKGFETLSELVLIFLTKCSSFYQVKAPLEIINISGTYYMKSITNQENIDRRKTTSSLNNEKIYLLQGIKKHNLFKNFKFWEAALLNHIDASKEDFDFHAGRMSIEFSLINKNFKSKISRTFMTIAIHMLDLDCKKEVVMRLFGVYFHKYKLGEEFFMELNNFLVSNFNSDEFKTGSIILPKKGEKKSQTFSLRNLPNSLKFRGNEGFLKKAMGIFKNQN